MKENLPVQLDPEHVAQVCRELRAFRGLTQERLAEAADVSTRTIEKIESGRHAGHEDTLAKVAYALGVEAMVFRRPTADEAAKAERTAREALTKYARAVVAPVTGTGSVLDALGEDCCQLTSDLCAVTDPSVLPVAAGLVDDMIDFMDITSVMTMSARVEAATAIAEVCDELHRAKHQCCLGTYRQVLPAAKNRTQITFSVTLVIVRPQSAPLPPHVLVKLTGGWVCHPDDHPNVSPTLFAELAVLHSQIVKGTLPEG